MNTETKEFKDLRLQDDVYLFVKKKIMEELDEHNSALFIGKFRIFTKKHFQIISEALNSHKFVFVTIIKGEKSDKISLSFESKKKLLEEEFGDRVIVLEHSNGYLPSIIKKCYLRVKTIYAGSDRIEGYRKQFKGRNLPFEFIEINRDDEISATSTIQAIIDNDEKRFNLYVPKILENRLSEIKEKLNIVEDT